MVWKIKKFFFFFFLYLHIREVLSHSQECRSQAAFPGGSRMIREGSHVCIWFFLFGPNFDLYRSLNRLPIWNSQNCSMFPLAFVAGWLQGHWWGFISRNYVVWPTFLLISVFIALKGSHFWFLFKFWPDQTNHFAFGVICPRLLKKAIVDITCPWLLKKAIFDLHAWLID